MPDQDKRMTWTTVQFGTIVGLLLLTLLSNLGGMFFDKDEGMSKETIAQLEDIMKTFEQINKESRVILEENKRSNLELERFLEEKKGVRRESYQSMMDEYQLEMKGVIPSGSTNKNVEHDPVTEVPRPEG
ncbi:hypothetical protein HWC35_gp043 [Vibrio phage USC-1]|uniref:Uncharacterized protein n=2 Tax=Aphroditevirus USC1 TaxID=2846605 RepID=A0A514A2C5_9CAUD|nr:hypothetical protein HWC35_gp043 [Vibrio phage USC-1]QCW23291.1 hypothetical protein [Vibrio phage 5 TSL-2019]QDH47437.1 hypothetical protein [Vibrio phage USC-1]